MVSEKELYNLLNDDWQRPQDIRGKAAESRGKKRWQILIGPMYIRLDSLVTQGFAETREREPTKEESNVRGNNKVKEYKRVSERKSAYDKIEKIGDLGLVPV